MICLCCKFSPSNQGQGPACVASFSVPKNSLFTSYSMNSIPSPPYPHSILIYTPAPPLQHVKTTTTVTPPYLVRDSHFFVHLFASFLCCKNANHELNEGVQVHQAKPTTTWRHLKGPLFSSWFAFVRSFFASCFMLQKRESRTKWGGPGPSGEANHDLKAPEGTLI